MAAITISMVLAIVIQHAQVDQVGCRRDAAEYGGYCPPGKNSPVPGDDAGNMLSVSVMVVRAAANEVLSVDDSQRAARVLSSPGGWKCRYRSPRLRSGAIPTILVSDSCGDRRRRGVNRPFG